MFHRIQIEDYVAIFQQIGFKLFLAVFIFAVLKVIIMPRKQVQRVSALPLDDEKIKEAHAYGKKEE